MAALSFFSKIIFSVLIAASAVSAFGQTYPNRPIRLIAPFPAGSGVDIMARIIAEKLTEIWRQQVIVDNRSGASGIIGSEIAAKSSADGYTLIMSNASTHAVNVSLFKNLPYDPVQDFSPITLVALIPEILVVNPSVPANSVKELIELAKAKRGQLTFGSAGAGTPVHLAAELFKTLAGIDIVHVPYKGAAPALTDLIGGQITMYFSNTLSVAPHIKANRLRALGVTTARRSVVFPQVPTIAEAGLPGYEEHNWYGMLAPMGTPKIISAKLNETIVRILKTPEVADRLTKQDLEIVANTQDEFGLFIKKEIDKYARIVRSSGLRVD